MTLEDRKGIKRRQKFLIQNCNWSAKEIGTNKLNINFRRNDKSERK